MKKNIVKNEAFSDIITRMPSKFIRWGSLWFFLLLVLVFLLMGIVKYPDNISAEGYLTTPIPPQKLYAPLTTRIDTLLVSDNEPVKKNTILAIFENTANNGNVLLLKSITDTLPINQTSMYFPFRKLPMLFLGELEVHFANFEISYYEYILNKDLRPLSNKIQTKKLSLVQLNSQFHNLVNQKSIHEKELVYITKDLNRHKALLDKGIISQQAYEDKQLMYYSELKNFENTKFLISQLRASIVEASGSTNNLEFSRERENTKLLKQVIQSYSQLKRSIRDWELKYVLKSDCNGVVSFLEQWYVKQTVKKDSLMFTVSTEGAQHYIAKLKTPKDNSGKIKIGQRASFSLNDYPEYEFGVLTGKVINISNVSSVNGNYHVDIKISKGLKTSFGKEIGFKQDMQGTARIITEDLSLLERLFYQFRHLFNS